MNLPSPLERIHHPLAEQQGITWWVKRDDQIHPLLSGNKYRKLRDNLKQATSTSKTRLVTFGGAYSNHIAAVAGAGQLFGFSTIGFIRGEEQDTLNPTLQAAKNCGMELYYLDRTTYRRRDSIDFQQELLQDLPNSYLIPEGGTNAFALPGCAAIVDELFQQMDQMLPDFITLACGTGGTLAGLTSGLSSTSTTKVLGFPVLKGEFMAQTVQKHLEDWAPGPSGQWVILEGYHFGGYARHTPALIDFINSFKATHQIPLDPIYTGKHFFGVLDKIKQGFFPPGSTVVSIHTGGLQGIAGFNQRFGNILL